MLLVNRYLLFYYCRLFFRNCRLLFNYCRMLFDCCGLLFNYCRLLFDYCGLLFDNESLFPFVCRNHVLVVFFIVIHSRETFLQQRAVIINHYRFELGKRFVDDFLHHAVGRKRHFVVAFYHHALTSVHIHAGTILHGL